MSLLYSVSRLNVAVDLYTAFSKYGPEKERLIIDPVLTPVMWQQSNKQAGEILSVISALPEVLGYPVKTIAALSNLTSGNKVKKQNTFLEKTYLPMLAASGLSMLMLNIFHDETVQTARLCNTLTRPGIFSWDDIK